MLENSSKNKGNFSKNPTSQFELKDTIHYFPQILQNKVVNFLVYIKSSIHSRQLFNGSICDYIQAIPFEINLTQQKWLVISICCSSSKDSGCFLHFLTKIIVHEIR